MAHAVAPSAVEEVDGLAVPAVVRQAELGGERVELRSSTSVAAIVAPASARRAADGGAEAAGGAGDRDDFALEARHAGLRMVTPALVGALGDVERGGIDDGDRRG